MNILLISANMARTPYPVFPLGVSMVATALIDAGHTVEHFDFLQHDLSVESVAQKIQDQKPDLIGISIRNIDNVNMLNEQRYLSVVRDIVVKARTVCSAKIILGGSAFSIMPEAILEYTGADYGIVGEGERLFVEFAARAADGHYPDTPCIRAQPQLTGQAIPSAQYDSAVMRFYLQEGTVASIQSKRGCPHHCLYCSYPDLEGREIRLRSPSAVVDDMQRLTEEHAAKYIFFTDSVFNDEAGHFMQVVDEMLKRNVTIPWTAFFKPGFLNDEIVQKMKTTGLKAAEIGADASSDTTLKALGKDFLFDDVVRCNDLFVQQGVAAAHFFIFGGPGESRDTVLEGINNLHQLKNAVIFAFMGIRILPNTPLLKLAIQQDVLASDHDLLDPVYYLSPSIEKEWLEQTLTDAFAKERHWVFPPDALDSTLSFLHKMGYSGSLWEMMGPGKRKRTRGQQPQA